LLHTIIRYGTRVKLAAESEAADIIRLFTDTCDQLKLHWTSKVRSVSAGGMYDIFISRRADVAFLDQHIGPKS